MSRFRFIPRKVVTLSRDEMYDLVRAPVITEKSTMASEHNQVTFRVPLTADKRAVKAAIEGLFKVKVTAVNTHPRQGQDQAVPRHARPPLRLQESDRHPRRGAEDRRDDRGLRQWHSKPTSRRRQASASSSSSTDASSGRAGR